MANDINSVNLVGRLVRDVDLSYLPSGTAVGKLSVAVNRSRKQNDQWIDEVSYFDISLFGKSAENLKPYLMKGKQIAVQGSLRQERWEKDGQKHSRISIIADAVQLLGGNNSFDNASQSYNGGSKENKIAPNNNYGDYAESQYADSDFPEDIPF